MSILLNSSKQDHAPDCKYETEIECIYMKLSVYHDDRMIFGIDRVHLLLHLPAQAL